MCAPRISRTTRSSIDPGPKVDDLQAGATDIIVPVILSQDADVLVVHKAAGTPVQTDATGDLDLLTRLRQQFKEPGIGLVHRLDRPVSGVVLFSRNAKSLTNLSDQFQDRQVVKVYWAIVEGAMKTMVLDHMIEHDAYHHKARIGAASSSGKQARTAVRMMAQGDRYTLVEVIPEGGAFHQIRAQLGAAGHSIKGDVKYGARRGEKDRSIALHARSVTFDHPTTGERVTRSAPPPVLPLWQALIDRMGTRG